MCCPCGELVRPTTFDQDHGGYVVMEKKALTDEPDPEKEEIAAMTEDEKIVKYIGAFINELPTDRIALEAGDEADPAKVMHVTRVETRVVMLKLKYGMDVGDKVDTLIRKLIENKGTGGEYTEQEIKHRTQAEELRAALVNAGFLPGDEAGGAEEQLQEVTAEGESDAKAAHKAKNAAKRAASESKKAAAKTVEEKFAAFSAPGGETMNFEQLDKFIAAEFNDEDQDEVHGLAAPYFHKNADVDDAAVMRIADFSEWFEKAMNGEVEEEQEADNTMLIATLVAGAVALGALFILRKK
jgi:hypothetical protein